MPTASERIRAAREVRNHGAVVREIVEYREETFRAVICELRDGWHVVEVYRPGQRTERHVTETLAEARTFARALLGA